MMIRMGLAEAAAAIGAQCLGDDVEFRGCHTDSRTLVAGSLFVALRGPNFDGHRYVAAARSRGARAALVSDLRAYDLPVMRVDDTVHGLGALAHHWRRGHRMPMVAITGSNGKTTVKEMVASILRQRGRVLATRGNLNNEIGVPLTLLGLSPNDRAAVIEMGANHGGEIRRLCEMARPSVGVITQCAPAHLEGFGSIEGVARAKGEIFDSLPADGVAVINADDPFAEYWREVAGGRRIVTFAMEAEADVSATWMPSGAAGRVILATPLGSIETDLRLPGRHSAMNAAAAAAAAIAVGAGLEAIEAGLAGMTAVAGRLQPTAIASGLEVIDDTYNANPASLDVALEVLCARPGLHWLVLGDMAELGPESDRFHADAGRAAKAAGVDELLCLGAGTRATVAAFGARGQHFESPDALVESLQQELAPPAAVLVKGSRSMEMERVVQALIGRTHQGVSPCC